MVKHIYLASGIFSEADRMYNRYLAKRIREAVPDVDLYLPQENTDINDKTKYADSLAIAKADIERIDQSDLMIVSLDNLEAGQGRCTEIGYAAGREIPVIGLYTDTRQLGTDNPQKIKALIEERLENQFGYVNLFVVGVVKMNGDVVTSVDELINLIKRWESEVVRDEDEDVSQDTKKMAEIYAESLATYEKKNHDYGNSFGDLMDEMGVIVGIAQIVHKTNRAKTLIMKGEQHVEDESLEETLMDLITYTAMTINKIREQEEVTAND